MLLRPIASLLLKCGMTWRQFAEISKTVFVEVATAEYGLGGRPTNVSRVSILTGLSRKEVVRVRDLLDAPNDSLHNKTTDATRLLSGWHQDADFLDAAGQPLVVNSEGPGPSFATLWQRYGGDAPQSTMRKELERAGAITLLSDGLIRVERRYFMPRPFDPQWIMNAGSTLRDLGTSISHNLDAPVQDRRFIGRSTNDSIDRAALPEFEAFIDKNGQEFLEKVDKWLTDHEARAGYDGERKRMRLGMGMFLISGE